MNKKFPAIETDPRKVAAMKKKIGRPTIFSEKLAAKICKQVASGISLRRICRKKNMPSRETIFSWLADERKKVFIDQYRTSSNVRAEELFDEIEETAKDGKLDVNRARLIIDTRKWYLSKIMPKKYGDKLDLTTKGKELPCPILNNVRAHNSNGKNPQTEKED